MDKCAICKEEITGIDWAKGRSGKTYHVLCAVDAYEKKPLGKPVKRPVDIEVYSLYQIEFPHSYSDFSFAVLARSKAEALEIACSDGIHSRRYVESIKLLKPRDN